MPVRLKIVPYSRRQLEKRMDELARRDHVTHDPEVKSQIESLSKRLAIVPQREEEDPDCE